MVEVDGIKVELSADTLDDMDVIECIADCNDPELDGIGQMRAVVRLLRTVFGDDYGRIKDELRERGGGRLTVEAVSEFFNRACELAGAKN